MRCSLCYPVCDGDFYHDGGSVKKISDIELVIFDCDGTLVDSETVSMRVFRERIGDLGFQIEQQEALDRYAGRDLNEVLVEIGETLDRPVPERFMQDFRVAQIARLQRELVAFPGIHQLLSEVRVPYCVASNAPRFKIETCLETTSLSGFFSPETIFSAYDIDRWKPAPDLFQLAAQTAGVHPESCLVVEDSLSGVEAGLAAGMQVIVFDPHVRQDSPFADLPTVSSMEELRQHLPLA